MRSDSAQTRAGEELREALRAADEEFLAWWVSEHGGPPTVDEYGQFAAARSGWDASYRLYKVEELYRAVEDLKARLRRRKPS